MSDKYWVNGTGLVSDAANHWAVTSGGSPGVGNKPTATDNAIFDGSSGVGTVTIDEDTSCLNLDFTDTTLLTIDGTEALNIYGSLVVKAGMSWDYVGNVYFKATSIGKTVKTNGVTINSYSIAFDGAGGEWTLQDDLYVNINETYIYVNNGHLNTGGFDIYGYSMSSSPSGGDTYRTITLNDSVITLREAWTMYNPTNLAINAGTSLIKLGWYFEGAGKAYYDVEGTFFDHTQGGPSFNNDGGTFHNLTIKPKYTWYVDSEIHTEGDFAVTGTLTFANWTDERKLLWVGGGGISSVIQSIITVNAVAGLSDINFQNINIQGVSSPWSGTRIGDGGNNTNISFDAPRTLYWVGDGGDTGSTDHWSLASNGASGEPIPLPQDSIIFNEYSIVSGEQEINFNTRVLGKNIDFSAVTVDFGINCSFGYVYSYGDVKLSNHIINFSGYAYYGWYVFGRTDVNLDLAMGGTVIGTSFRCYGLTSNKFLFTEDAAFANGFTFSGMVDGATIDFNGKTLDIENGFDLWIEGENVILSILYHSAIINIIDDSTVSFSSSNSNNSYGEVDNTGIINFAVGGTIQFDWNVPSWLPIVNLIGRGEVSGPLLFLAYNNIQSIYELNVDKGDQTVTFNQYSGNSYKFVNKFNVRGQLGHLSILQSYQSGTPVYLTKEDGIVDCDYLNIQDMHVSGGAWWSKGYNSVDISGNEGWASTLIVTFTIDGEIKLTKHFTLDGIVFATNQYFFTVDGDVFATMSYAFTVSGDIHLNKRFTIDGGIFGTMDWMFTVSGYVRDTFSYTFLIDGLVIYQYFKTITLDGIFVERKTTDEFVSTEFKWECNEFEEIYFPTSDWGTNPNPLVNAVREIVSGEYHWIGANWEDAYWWNDLPWDYKNITFETKLRIVTGDVLASDEHAATFEIETVTCDINLEFFTDGMQVKCYDDSIEEYHLTQFYLDTSVDHVYKLVVDGDNLKYYFYIDGSLMFEGTYTPQTNSGCGVYFEDNWNGLEAPEHYIDYVHYQEGVHKPFTVDGFMVDGPYKQFKLDIHIVDRRQTGWSGKWECNDLPEDSGLFDWYGMYPDPWVNGVREIVDGAFHLTHTNTDWSYLYEGVTPQFTTNGVVEMRVKYTGILLSSWDNTLQLSLYTTNGYASLNVYEDGVRLQYNDPSDNTQYFEFVLDATQYHTYRLVIKGVQLTFYIDDELVLTAIVYTANNTPEIDINHYIGYVTDQYIDYVYWGVPLPFTVDGIVSPPYKYLRVDGIIAERKNTNWDGQWDADEFIEVFNSQWQWYLNPDPLIIATREIISSQYHWSGDGSEYSYGQLNFINDLVYLLLETRVRIISGSLLASSNLGKVISIGSKTCELNLEYFTDGVRLEVWHGGEQIIQQVYLDTSSYHTYKLIVDGNNLLISLYIDTVLQLQFSYLDGLDDGKVIYFDDNWDGIATEHYTDYFYWRTSPSYFTVDGIVFGEGIKTFTIDGIILTASAIAFTLDGIIKEIFIKQVIVDGIVRAVTSRLFTVDGSVRDTFTRTFTLDGIVAYQRYFTFTVDAKVKAFSLCNFTVDGDIYGPNTYDFIIDGIIITCAKILMDGIVVVAYYLLNEEALPRPNRLLREFVFLKTDYYAMTGKTLRDVSYQKQKYILQWDDITNAQAEAIEAMVKTNQAVYFSANDHELQIASVKVFGFVASKEYTVLGSEYRVSMTLDLVEEDA